MNHRVKEIELHFWVMIIMYWIKSAYGKEMREKETNREITLKILYSKLHKHKANAMHFVELIHYYVYEYFLVCFDRRL